MSDKKKDSKGDAATELLIQEIEEDLKHEQYSKLWSKYGNVVIAFCVAVVAVVAGYQGWRSYYKDLRVTEATAYAAANELAKPTETAAALDRLALEAKTGYETLAKLRRAAVLAESGDAKAALAAYQAIAADTRIDRPYRDLAGLRAALLALSLGEDAAAQAQAQSLLNGAWRHAALEVQAVLAQRAGEIVRAREYYQQLADDMATPQALRARAAEMLAALPALQSDKKG